MKITLITLTFLLIALTGCSAKSKPIEKTDNTKLTLEKFLPYLDGKHNINDVQKAFPNPTFFNSGGAFIWATYNLEDGTKLTVGEHYKGKSTLSDSNGKVIKIFPFASYRDKEKLNK